MNDKSINNLFLRQSCLDSWQEYQSWLEKGGVWDYIVLTASNEAQASGYREEISQRLSQGYLPASCEYIVLSDPEGKRVGSGGATLNVLRCLVTEYGGGSTAVLHGRRILVIHSGGDSRRVPQYSVCGKLFSPVPRQLPDGRPSTLFDEFMISMSAVAGRFEEGMLVLSGDVLLLFNPLQLDFQYQGAAAISIKADVTVGKDHGVFLSNGQGYVSRFLHKQSEEQLHALGVVNSSGKVNLDTGAVLMDGNLLEALFSLISVESGTDGDGILRRRLDKERFARFVNERSRISFYGDFLYPLATDSTLEGYEKEAPEGSLCQELLDCRREIWQVLSPFSMKLLCLSPAEFIHFGTTRELLGLMTENIGDYQFLDWSSRVNTNATTGEYTVYNSIVDPAAAVGRGVYLENCLVGSGVRVGEGSVLADIGVSDPEIFVHARMRDDRLAGGPECRRPEIFVPTKTRGVNDEEPGVEEKIIEIPAHVVIHGLVLPGEKYVARIYGVADNPKDTLEDGARWLGSPVEEVLSDYHIPAGLLWEGEGTQMWFARLYPVCGTMEEAVRAALLVKRIFQKEAVQEEVDRWIAGSRLSLYDSFSQARAADALAWKQKLMRMISVRQFVEILEAKGSYQQARKVFSCREMTAQQFMQLLELAEQADFSLKIRLYYSLSCYLREQKQQFNGVTAQQLESKCFGAIQEAICNAGREMETPSLESECFGAIQETICNTGREAETSSLESECFGAIQETLCNAGREMETSSLESKCFGAIQETICNTGREAEMLQECTVELPVRVNWGGGWTDTPPYCNENGGIVLNAAIKLKGIFPVQVTIRRLEEYHIEFASEDIGVFGTFHRLEEILDCHNPYDHFALHKAALIACGLVPAVPDGNGRQVQTSEAEDIARGLFSAERISPDLLPGEGKTSRGLPPGTDPLTRLLHRLGGGLYLSTRVVGIPKGSGLGTSSILAGACVKAIYQFLGRPLSEDQLYNTVLRMEQIMSTGGGWQDQVGGLCPGIKLITSKPGILQQIQVEPLKLSRECLQELQERFALIYTGQRRLARNLLREVVGNYIGGRPQSVQALEEMKRIAVLMKYELECGNIDRFAQLLNTHWQLSLQLDSGASNTCIDQIFRSCEDLIDGRFIAGAGGGGFLQVILKKGVTHSQLNRRLYDVFQDSGVAVWECEFV